MNGVELEKLSLDDIKKLELNLLMEFDKLCKNNDLYYTMCGGTLLGAIRHKGFIPWDDDIDVFLTRESYERLLNDDDIDYSCLSNYVEVASWKKGNMDMPFIKLLDKRTVVDSKYSDDKKTNKIWIDILPIDGNSNNNLISNIQYKYSKLLRRILLIKLSKSGEGKTAIKRLLKPVVKVLTKPLSIKYLITRIDSISKRYNFNDADKIGCVLWGYGPWERIDKKSFMEPIELEFEGNYFMAPANYDEYLTNLYHNYMELPPEDARKTHDMIAYKKVKKKG